MHGFEMQIIQKHNSTRNDDSLVSCNDYFGALFLGGGGWRRRPWCRKTDFSASFSSAVLQVGGGARSRQRFEV